MKIGARIVTKGLSAVEFNGLYGTVVTECDKEERYGVILSVSNAAQSNGGSKTVKLKASNISEVQGISDGITSEIKNSACSPGPIEANLLLGQMLAVWQSVNTIPCGFLRRAPSSRICVVGPPRASYQVGCPRSFGEFVSHGLFGATEADAFAWFARVQLRFSCSSLACTFARYVVPELQRIGICEMLMPCGATLLLSDLRVIEVRMHAPQEKHTIELSRIVSEDFVGRGLTDAQARKAAHELYKELSKIPQLEKRGDGELCESQTVERAFHDASSSLPQISHNLLRCKKTGAFVDFSLGQFSGEMNPDVYSDEAAFAKMLPSSVLRIYESPEAEVESQNERDKGLASKSPGLLPLKFAQRVVRACAEANFKASGLTTFCKNCFSSVAGLLKCSRCQNAAYCSKACQKLNWKRHKPHCTRIE